MRKNFKAFLFLSLFFSKAIANDSFPYTPPPNFNLEYDYIKVHHPVTTNNLAAQALFDQGLTFIYAFNHDAAYWSFLRASQADPEMPMAYWGMALALGKNINMDAPLPRENEAYQIIQKALSIQRKITPSEQDYLSALATRYSNDPKPDLEELSKNYSVAMRGLADKYPDDPDASVLFAESLLDVRPWNQWSNDGKPLDGTLEAVNALESVLKEYPDHLGANHYYIHVIEASSHPEWALMSAERLKTLLPSSGHILHMPSHIYLLLGDYRKAVLANQQAIAADKAYIYRYGLDGIYPVHYLSHNLYFLSRAYAMEGNYLGAKQAAIDLKNFYSPHFKHMPELEYYEPTPLFIFLRFNKYKEILNLPKPRKEMQLTESLWHFGRAVAFSGLGQKEDALKEKDLFLETASEAPENAMYGLNKFKTIIAIAENYLDAKLSLADGDRKKAIDFLTKAVGIQDTLRYNEPPDWFFPLRESLGGLLLQEEQFAEAERVFREDLSHHPKNGRSLFGLREALRGQSKFDDLYWVEQEFAKAWRYSDTKLTIKQL